MVRCNNYLLCIHTRSLVEGQVKGKLTDVSNFIFTFCSKFIICYVIFSSIKTEMQCILPTIRPLTHNYKDSHYSFCINCVDAVDPLVRLFCMLITPLSINPFPNHSICPTSKLTSISSSTGSAVISLLLRLPKPNPWLFKPRRAPSLTWSCTSTISQKVCFIRQIPWDTDHWEPFLESPGWSYKLAERWGHQPGFPQCPG